MVNTPQEYILSNIGKQVEVYTFNGEKYRGLMKGIDIYANVLIRDSKEENDILINGSNVVLISSDKIKL